MAFYQFSFIKLLHFKVGTIIILFIYLFFNSSYDLSDQQVSKIPHPKNPKKIDSYGRDIWFLTEENELFHWYPVLESLIFKESDVLDFSIGADGTIAITKKDNEVYIRTDKWEQISYGNYEHKNVSVYSSYVIYTTDSRNHLIQAIYDSPDTYSWACLDCLKKYYQISCPISQMDDDYSDYRSLWIIGSDHYIYKYSTNKKYIAISESPFKQIKVFNDQYIIGIDINNNLWKYRDGNWVLIRNNVKYATLNYLREIYFIDNDNLAFKMKS